MELIVLAVIIGLIVYFRKKKEGERSAARIGNL